MLTKTPTVIGLPRGHSRASVMTCHAVTSQLLTAMGSMIDVAAMGLGINAADIAEWAGTLLIRWAQQDRAVLGEPLSHGD